MFVFISRFLFLHVFLVGESCDKLIDVACSVMM